MENKDNCKVVVASSFIKEKSVITLNGEVIRNTPENPHAVEDYFRSKRG